MGSHFGCGYHLIFSSAEGEFSTDQVDDILKQCHTVIPETKLERHIGQDLNIVLPFEAVDRFPKLFTALDDEQKRLGFESYGILLTSMDEVFLKCAHQSNKKDDVYIADAKTDNFKLQDPKFGGFILFLMQIKACLTKNVKVWIRDWNMYVTQFLAAVGFAIVIINRHQTSKLFSPQANDRLLLSTKGWYDSYDYVDQKVPVFIDESVVDLQDNLTTCVVNSLDNTYESQLFLGNKSAEADDILVENFNSIGNTAFDQSYFQGIGFSTSKIFSGWLFTNPWAHTTVKNAAHIMYNGQHFHTLPSAHSFMSNVLLKFFQMSDGKEQTASITSYNHPLPLNKTELKNVNAKSEDGANFGRNLASNMLFSFVCAMMTKHVVTEKASKSKHVQTLAGINSFVYWFSFYLVDLVKASILCFLVAMYYKLSGDSVFGWEQQWQYCFSYLFLICWAMLPLMYLFSLLFQTPSVCVVLCMFLSTILSIVLRIFLAMWRSALSDEGSESEAYIKLENATRDYFPPYTFQDILEKHYTNNESIYLCTQNDEFANLCEEENITYSPDYWAYEDESGLGVGRQVALMCNQGLIYFCILVILEFLNNQISIKGIIMNNLMKKNQVTIGGNGQELDYEDVDVVREMKAVQADPDIHKKHVLVTKGVQKVYVNQNSTIMAVQNNNFRVKRNTCFGLLGINGAGKTTLFKMLTGDESVTSGDCYINGYSIVTEKAKAQAQVGYTPQFDALIEHLTGKETLEMYSDLRGLTTRDKEHSVKELLRVLDILPHMNKPCGIYSGGNKRKLSVALAMIGEPPLLFLDEPSTGMDPGARHALWDGIVKIQNRGTSVVLTSHSMEECEALCSSLAIMVNGRFKCFGSVQHLRNRFGQGYTLEVSLKEENEESARIVEETFKEYELYPKESHGDYFVYDFPWLEEKEAVGGEEDSERKTNVTLSILFTKMEALKNMPDSNFVSYSVRQRTLEELFLSFTKSQRVDTLQG